MTSAARRPTTRRVLPPLGMDSGTIDIDGRVYSAQRGESVEMPRQDALAAEANQWRLVPQWVPSVPALEQPVLEIKTMFTAADIATWAPDWVPLFVPWPGESKVLVVIDLSVALIGVSNRAQLTAVSPNGMVSWSALTMEDRKPKPPPSGYVAATVATDLFSKLWSDIANTAIPLDPIGRVSRTLGVAEAGLASAALADKVNCAIVLLPAVAGPYVTGGLVRASVVADGTGYKVGDTGFVTTGVVGAEEVAYTIAQADAAGNAQGVTITPGGHFFKQGATYLTHQTTGNGTGMTIKAEQIDYAANPLQLFVAVAYHLFG